MRRVSGVAASVACIQYASIQILIITVLSTSACKNDGRKMNNFPEKKDNFIFMSVNICKRAYNKCLQEISKIKI